MGHFITDEGVGSADVKVQQLLSPHVGLAWNSVVRMQVVASQKCSQNVFYFPYSVFMVSQLHYQFLLEYVKYDLQLFSNITAKLIQLWFHCNVLHSLLCKDQILS